MLNLLAAIPMLAHVLIGFYFAFFGFWNVYHWRPITEEMLSRNIPVPFMILSGGIFWQTVTGFMIMFSIYVKLAALLLIPFTIMSVFIFHPFWNYRGEHRRLNFSFFMANLTMSVSALLLLLTNITPLTRIADLLS